MEKPCVVAKEENKAETMKCPIEIWRIRHISHTHTNVVSDTGTLSISKSPSIREGQYALGCNCARNRVTAKLGCNLHFGLHLFFNLSFLMKDEMDSLGSATNSWPNK